eukprot:jgi/Chrzof1/9105/Cz03g36060.t1
MPKQTHLLSFPEDLLSRILHHTPEDPFRGSTLRCVCKAWKAWLAQAVQELQINLDLGDPFTSHDENVIIEKCWTLFKIYPNVASVTLKLAMNGDARCATALDAALKELPGDIITRLIMRRATNTHVDYLPSSKLDLKHLEWLDTLHIEPQLNVSEEQHETVLNLLLEMPELQHIMVSSKVHHTGRLRIHRSALQDRPVHNTVEVIAWMVTCDGNDQLELSPTSLWHSQNVGQINAVPLR